MAETDDTRSLTDAAAEAEAKQRRARRRRRRTIVKWVKRSIWVAVAVALIALTVRAFLPKPVPVDAAPASRGKMVVTIDEDGKTRVKDRYVILAPLTGNMMRINLEPGDRVAESAEIVRILPATPALLDVRTRQEAQARLAAAIAQQRQAQAMIGAASTAFQQAESEVKRLQPLAARGATPKANLERAEFQARSRREELRSARFAAKVAAEQVASARAALGLLTPDKTKPADGDNQLRVIAPTRGTVLRVLRRDAGLVAAGTQLLELGDPQQTEVVADVLTRDAVKIEPGARVVIHGWGRNVRLEGHVHRIEPSAFERLSALGVQEQRVNVIIHIEADRQLWRALGDGYRVEVSIVTWQGNDVLTVPASSVFRQGNSWAVFAIAGGKARLTPIEIGHRNPTRVEVTKGLSAGTEVVLHPSDQIRDGVGVRKRAH